MRIINYRTFLSIYERILKNKKNRIIARMEHTYKAMARNYARRISKRYTFWKMLQSSYQANICIKDDCIETIETYKEEGYNKIMGRYEVYDFDCKKFEEILKQYLKLYIDEEPIYLVSFFDDTEEKIKFKVACKFISN